MTNNLKIIIFLIIFLFALPSFCLAGRFKVTRVYDGDTIRAEGYGSKIKVRLAGIDAPEICKEKSGLSQPYSKDAKRYLSHLILNKIIEIRDYGLKGPGLYLGEILLNSKKINLEMVQAGLAEVYRGEPPEGFDLKSYFKAEREARKAKKGMWIQEDAYVSPKEYLETERRKSIGALLLYGLCGQKGK